VDGVDRSRTDPSTDAVSDGEVDSRFRITDGTRSIAPDRRDLEASPEATPRRDQRTVRATVEAIALVLPLEAMPAGLLVT
jgi:hypothetical protein